MKESIDKKWANNKKLNTVCGMWGKFDPHICGQPWPCPFTTSCLSQNTPAENRTHVPSKKRKTLTCMSTSIILLHRGSDWV